MTPPTTYASGGAVLSALRDAARSTVSEFPVDRRIQEALHDRFLCRVFRDDEERFALKGGTAMLARLPRAGSTRDVDLTALDHQNLDDAQAELATLSDADMGDHLVFRLSATRSLLAGTSSRIPLGGI